MVSTRPFISKSSSPCTNPLVIVQRTFIIGIAVTFMFYSFFNSLARSRYLFFFSLSFNLTLWSAGTAKFTIRQVLFFLLIITRSGRLAEVRWSVCISKSLRRLCVSFSMTNVGLIIIIIVIISLLVSFSYQREIVIFHKSLSDCKSLSIRVDSTMPCSDFQFLQMFFLAVGDRSKCANYN